MTELFEIAETRRAPVRGETRRPQVDASELLSGLLGAMKAGAADRAQGRLYEERKNEGKTR
jgi:hypothetical protein